jgi:hypothetical protein
VRAAAERGVWAGRVELRAECSLGVGGADPEVEVWTLGQAWLDIYVTLPRDAACVG